LVHSIYSIAGFNGEGQLSLCNLKKKYTTLSTVIGAELRFCSLFVMRDRVFCSRCREIHCSREAVAISYGLTAQQYSSTRASVEWKKISVVTRDVA
jgi:hypothetical protein